MEALLILFFYGTQIFADHHRSKKHRPYFSVTRFFLQLTSIRVKYQTEDISPVG
jgi:hypothetical protein